MTLKDQVFTQARVMAGPLDNEQSDLLSVLCTAAVNSLAARLREGLTPADCKADFIAAASLFALAALNGVGDSDPVRQVKIGDVTMTRADPRDAASNCLRNQAQMLIAPYLKDRFSFRGV